MAGCRAYTELEAEKLTCEIVELENSVMHLVSLWWCSWGTDLGGLPYVAIHPRHGRSLVRKTE
jgi:hypothetical protein